VPSDLRQTLSDRRSLDAVAVLADEVQLPVTRGPENARADRDVDAAEAALAGVPVRAAVLNEALHLVSAVRHHATSGTRNMSARVAHSSADQPARSAPSSSFKDFTPSTSSRSKYDSTTIRAVSAS